MTMRDKSTTLEEVESKLPEILGTSTEDLLEGFGLFWWSSAPRRESLAAREKIRWADLTDEQRRELKQEWWKLEQFSAERLRKHRSQQAREFARSILYDYLRPIICDAANRQVIDNTLKTANVAAVVDLIAPHISLLLGQPPGPVPVPVIGIAVMTLRIGLNEFCKGQKSSPTPENATVARQRRTPRTP